MNIDVKKIMREELSKEPMLHGVADRIMERVARQNVYFTQKEKTQTTQRIVEQLDEAGFFDLRNAVHKVSQHLDICRVTVYKYTRKKQNETPSI